MSTYSVYVSCYYAYMNTPPKIMQLEFHQPENEVEINRVRDHAVAFHALHNSWSPALRNLGKRGFLMRNVQLIDESPYEGNLGFIDHVADDTLWLRMYGLSANDIGVLDQQLAEYRETESYIALYLARHMDTGLAHFSLFLIDHATTNQTLIFHRSDCILESQEQRWLQGTRKSNAS